MPPPELSCAGGGFLIFCYICYRIKLLTMQKINNPWAGIEGYNCFGCSPDNPLGLRMSFAEDGDYIVSVWEPSGTFQG